MRHRPPESACGGAAVLDIGGDVGALLVVLDAVPPSGELHGRAVGASAASPFHTGVHVRGAGEGAAIVALFPALRAGAYELLGPDGAPTAPVVVTGGQVTRLALGGAVTSPHAL